MAFLAQARRFTPAEFSSHFNALDFDHASWAPKLFVLHNTDQPNLRQWLDPHTSPEQRLVNLRAYYKGLNWHSGPHWFIGPDAIWEFCDPLHDGVHCSCANHVAFGCEMVGDYATEDFASGPGGQVRDNAVHVVATVFKRFGWQPDPLVLWQRGLAFHKHCARDHHDCPGRNVDRADMVARVVAAMAVDTSPPVSAGLATPLPAAEAPAIATREPIVRVQTALNALGARPSLKLDGVMV